MNILTKDELRKQFQLTEKKVAGYINEDMPHLKIGREFRFIESEVSEWIAAYKPSQAELEERFIDEKGRKLIEYVQRDSVMLVLKITKEKIYNLCRSGMPYVVVGRKRFYHLGDIIEYFRRGKVVGKTTAAPKVNTTPHATPVRFIVDGSYDFAYDAYGAGVVRVEGEKTIVYSFGKQIPLKNSNYSELLAIYHALQLIKQEGLTTAVLYTDQHAIVDNLRQSGKLQKDKRDEAHRFQSYMKDIQLLIKELRDVVSWRKTSELPSGNDNKLYKNAHALSKRYQETIVEEVDLSNTTLSISEDNRAHLEKLPPEKTHNVTMTFKKKEKNVCFFDVHLYDKNRSIQSQTQNPVLSVLSIVKSFVQTSSDAFHVVVKNLPNIEQAFNQVSNPLIQELLHQISDTCTFEFEEEVKKYMQHMQNGDASLVPSHDIVEYIVDGSYDHERDLYGAGVVKVDAAGTKGYSFGKQIPYENSSVSECMAMYHALQMVKEDKPEKAVIYTDQKPLLSSLQPEGVLPASMERISPLFQADFRAFQQLATELKEVVTWKYSGDLPNGNENKLYKNAHALSRRYHETVVEQEDLQKTQLQIFKADRMKFKPIQKVAREVNVAFKRVKSASTTFEVTYRGKRKPMNVPSNNPVLAAFALTHDYGAKTDEKLHIKVNGIPTLGKLVTESTVKEIQTQMESLPLHCTIEFEQELYTSIENLLGATTRPTSQLTAPIEKGPVDGTTLWVRASYNTVKQKLGMGMIVQQGKNTTGYAIHQQTRISNQIFTTYLAILHGLEYIKEHKLTKVTMMVNMLDFVSKINKTKTFPLQKWMDTPEFKPSIDRMITLYNELKKRVTFVFKHTEWTLEHNVYMLSRRYTNEVITNMDLTSQQLKEVKHMETISSVVPKEAVHDLRIQLDYQLGSTCHFEVYFNGTMKKIKQKVPNAISGAILTARSFTNAYTDRIRVTMEHMNDFDNIVTDFLTTFNIKNRQVALRNLHYLQQHCELEFKNDWNVLLESSQEKTLITS